LQNTLKKKLGAIGSGIWNVRRRIESKIENGLGEIQFGFRRG
jgi:hypothetical protein